MPGFPFACRSCGYDLGRRPTDRRRAGRPSDLSFELTGRAGAFARVVCPICGANCAFVGGPVSLLGIDIARFADAPATL